MTIRAIILNYNSIDCTVRCVNSLLKQLAAPSHIVVVDNHSENYDFQLLKRSLPAGVTVIRNEKNLGYAAGNNRACGRLGGLPKPDFYFFANSDVCLSQTNSLSLLHKALADNPKAVAISPLVHTLSNQLPVRVQIQVRRLLPPIWLMLLHSPIFRRLPGFKNRYNHFIYFDLVPYKQGVYRVDTVNGACFLVRSSFFDSIGHFDEGTFLYLEELILGEQIRRTGNDCLLHGDVIVTHEQGISSSALTDQERFRYFLQSERHLLGHYYSYKTSTLTLLSVWRWAEFYGKRAIRPRKEYPHHNTDS